MRDRTGADVALCRPGCPRIRHGGPSDEYRPDMPTNFTHGDFNADPACTWISSLQNWTGTDILGHRQAAIIHTWRMLSEPPQDNLLTVCDRRTFTEGNRSPGSLSAKRRGRPCGCRARLEDRGLFYAMAIAAVVLNTAAMLRCGVALSSTLFCVYRGRAGDLPESSHGEVGLAHAG